MTAWARQFRTSVTTSLTQAAVTAAPRVGPGVIDALETAVGWLGPYAPILSSVVAENMRAAGVYSPVAHREYFARAGAHLGGVLHVLRYAHRPATGHMHPELARLVERRIRLDDSFECLRRAAAGGKGVVLLGVHASEYMLVLARINQELPITVYLRHSRDAHKQAAKRAWCAATGLSFIAEPPGLLNPSRRAELMADALRAGRVLIVTPDLAQKRELGVPVRVLDREVYLPGGPAALSLLLEAPLVTVVAGPASEGNCYGRGLSLRFFGPAPVVAVQRRRGWKKEAVRERLQWFADLFTNAFLRPHPALWFLWGDKRWTRVFRGDPRYTPPLAK